MQRFNGRERRRLERAREYGYLDAKVRENQKLVRAYGLWCWQLKIPMVWMERESPHSKFGRVRLEMFTTPNVLTPAGRSALEALAPAVEAAVSAHDACWMRVPLAKVAGLAKAAIRGALTVGNYRLNKTAPAKVDLSRLDRVVELPQRLAG
jgi:hypothetical protein